MTSPTSLSSRTARFLVLAACLLIAAGSAAPAAAQSAIDRYELDRNRKRERDRTFRRLSDGVLRMRKLSYESRADGLDIPFYLFEPLQLRGPRAHAALIWIHGGVHGDLDPTYFPFIREAVARGYVILAPEYRGSTGYGRAHHHAIDYGGYEVDDCLTAVDYMRRRLPHVDLERLGIIGWSHGGFITLHSVFRDQASFKAAAAMVPVTNLVFRLSYKGPRYARHFVAQERIGGPVHERRSVYVDRSPLYHVDKLRTPLLVHVADNDRDVNFEEAQQLIHALEYLKPDLAETRIYRDPPIDRFGGGHRFNRRVDRDRGYRRVDSPEQRDSWNRIWTFFDWHLRPYLTRPR
ncbi:MAG: S9 family peptidase [Acidobacteria bacterium]|nr:S9 family peptidase [Acidobacteriota bacterium]